MPRAQMPLLTRRQCSAALLAAGAPFLAAPLLADERASVLAAAKREGAMALATSLSLAEFPRFLAAFNRLYPFLELNSGYYSAPTGRVLARIDAELAADALSFDVMHIASVAAFMAYARKGHLLAYASPERDAHLPGSYYGDQWATARIVGIIMAYNKHRLAPDQAPRAWVDLLRPELKGRKLVIQDSAAGTTFNQFYLLEQELGVDFLKRLSAQQPVIVATAVQLIDLLVRGEALVGASVDHYRAFEPAAVKAGIVGVYPREGMPIAAVPIAIFRRAPHPNAAKLFVDFVLSHEGQQLLCVDIFGAYSTRADVAPPAGQITLEQAKPLRPKDLMAYEAAAAKFPEHFDTLFK
jgi:iron(III) transport system substrate-binding protein